MAVGNGQWQQRVAGTATVPVTATVALFGQTTFPTPRNWNRNRNRSWKPKTGLDLDWAGLDGTAQERTSHTARARFDRSSTHWPRNKRARVLAGLWILRAVDPGEMEEGNAEIEGQAKTQKKSQASRWERGTTTTSYVPPARMCMSLCLCLSACLPIDSTGPGD